MGLVEAVQTGSILLVLAVIVVALVGAVAYLFKLVVAELRRGRAEAEKNTAAALRANELLSTAFDKMADTTTAALNELRQR